MAAHGVATHEGPVGPEVSTYEPRIRPAGASRYVSANGLRHHLLTYGSGDAAVLVLPGITSPAITWEFVAQALVRPGRPVYALDIRGRGLSDHPATGYSLLEYAADAAGVIDALGLVRPAVLGHSMGARIAAALGAVDRDRCGPLVIVDPPLSGPGRDPYPTPLQSFLDQLREAGRGTTAEEVRRHYPNWTQRESEIRADWLATCSEAAVRESHRGFETEDFFQYWRQLTPPVQFVYGMQSPMVSEAGVRDVRAANGAARVVGIERAGHMIPWDNLAEFIEIVDRFLVDAEKGGGAGE